MMHNTEDRIVATCGPAGIEYIAPTFKSLLDGAHLPPKPEPVVTPRDVRDHGKRK